MVAIAITMVGFMVGFFTYGWYKLISHLYRNEPRTEN